MSVGHLLLAAGATGYIIVGVALEERDLQRQLGQAYAAYRARVPALVPISWNGRTSRRGDVEAGPRADGSATGPTGRTSRAVGR
jgi:hypothetical protein